MEWQESFEPHPYGYSAVVRLGDRRCGAFFAIPAAAEDALVAARKGMAQQMEREEREDG